MRILITGSDGQLGTDVAAHARRLGHTVFAADLRQMDITDESSVDRYFSAHQPDAVIHCAAYTAVDKAEDEAQTCMRVNADGTRHIAAAAQRCGAKLLYISTDYVYDGSGHTPWTEDAAIAPLNVYGQSKYAGEQAAHLCDKLFIVRTSWVFGLHGGNFVKTMLRLSESHDALQVVSDQIGSPTFTEDLAVLLCNMVETERYGVYHATNDGFCSWQEFATAIFQLFGRKVCVQPVRSADYRCRAKRPLNSRLSKQKLLRSGFKPLPHWKDALARFAHAYSSSDEN